MEVCGDGLDQNCDGAADEYCACSPVDPGVDGTLASFEHVAWLLPDPSRCLLYAIDAGSNSRPGAVQVIDLGAREVVEEIALAGQIDDASLSLDGVALVLAAHSGLPPHLWHVDTGTWAVTEVELAEKPRSVAPLAGGAVLYTVEDGEPYGPYLRWVSVAGGLRSDRVEVAEDPLGAAHYTDLEWSPSGELYVLTYSGIRAFSPELELLDATQDMVGMGRFSGEHLSFVGGGRYLSTRRFLIETADLDHAIAYFDDDYIVASDDQIGVSRDHVWDLGLGWTVATHDARIGSAVMVMGDRELWSELGGGLLSYRAAADVFDRSGLGQAHPPAPTARPRWRAVVAAG